jgi:hypothetical protein
MNYHIRTRTSQTVVEYTYYCRVCKNEMSEMQVGAYACSADYGDDHNSIVFVSDCNNIASEEITIYEPDGRGYLVLVNFVEENTTLAYIQKYVSNDDKVVRDIIFPFDDPFDRGAFIDRFNKLMVLV